MSQEEIDSILNNVPGTMCWVNSIKLSQRDGIGAFYEVIYSNPSSDSCSLKYNVWRSQIATLPDGTPAPAGYYEMKNNIVEGEIASCKCQ